MSQLPQAVQELTKTNKVSRWARCQDHNGKRSSIFRAVQPGLLDGHTYWVFKCSEKGGHLFLAEPDKTAPAVGGEAEWVALKLQERLVKLGLA